MVVLTLRILVLKAEKLSGFLKQGSKLFHSVMVSGNKFFLKKLCFVFRRGMLCTFRADYNNITGVKQESSWRNICDSHFPRPYKKRQSPTPTSTSKGLQFQFLKDFFFWRTLIAAVKATHALYWVDPSFSLNELLKH